MRIKVLIPKPLRLAYKLFHRGVRDYQYGQSQSFARTGKTTSDWTATLQTQQPILPGAFFENKIHNIRLAATKINRVVVEPGQVFSFWAVVGWPNRLRGYRQGRNLVNGKVQSAYGGGLCQVSGILYHLSLMAGLDIRERHNHSLDIYAEAERFAPLGADATVAYGYKDLRIQNNMGHPICFDLLIDENRLTAQLRSPIAISARTITFERVEMPPKRRVITFIDGELATESVYLVP